MFKSKRAKKEVVFWISLFVLLFLFVAFEKERPHINWDDMLFVLSYFSASLVISYLLIPRYLYKKKILKFCLSVFIVFWLVLILEEFVLEKIFYPDTRGLKTYYLPSFIKVIPPIMLFTGFKFAWDVFEKENEIEKLKRLAAENELQFLNSQINPHFLFNNLNNLYASALENSPDTPDIILRLSSILRYMLYDCRKAEVELMDEIDHLKQFVELYQMQIGNDAEIEFHTSGVRYDLQIAPLILIVFVENAFKHSQASQTEDIKINISVSVENDVLSFICENTYHEQSIIQVLAKGIGL